MTILDDATPTQYSLGEGKLLIQGKTVDTLSIRLFVQLYNANDEKLAGRWVNIPFTNPQKQAILTAVAAEIATIEAATGLTRFPD